MLHLLTLVTEFFLFLKTWLRLNALVEPYDFHDAENTDGIAESSHKNGIYSLTRNVTEFVKVWMN